MVDTYRPADLVARRRGGPLYTDRVSNTLGACFAAPAANRGVHPSTVTLASLLVGLASSGVVAFGGGAWWAGLVGLVGWQVAYALDCADGQLARATGKATPYGARLDVLCDLAVQAGVLGAIATLAIRKGHLHPAVVGAFAALWLVNLFLSTLNKTEGGEGHSLITSSSLPVKIVKLVRDYGALIAVVGLLATAWPAGMKWFVVAMTAVNGLFLLASIGREARLSLRGIA